MGRTQWTQGMWRKRGLVFFIVRIFDRKVRVSLEGCDWDLSEEMQRGLRLPIGLNDQF
jgi:hypothetical protein